jgi:putative transposase
MPNYRRFKVAGGTYFFTQVTCQRHSWLCHAPARETLRLAFIQVRQKYPFKVDACVLLPDHLHCIWTLPEGDHDYSTRWRMIKTFVTKPYGDRIDLNAEISRSRQKRRESNLWHVGFESMMCKMRTILFDVVITFITIR